MNGNVHTNAPVLKLKNIPTVREITYHIINMDFSNIKKTFAFNCYLNTTTKNKVSLLLYHIIVYVKIM